MGAAKAQSRQDPGALAEDVVGFGVGVGSSAESDALSGPRSMPAAAAQRPRPPRLLRGWVLPWAIDSCEPGIILKPVPKRPLQGGITAIRRGFGMVFRWYSVAAGCSAWTAAATVTPKKSRRGPSYHGSTKAAASAVRDSPGRMVVAGALARPAAGRPSGLRSQPRKVNALAVAHGGAAAVAGRCGDPPGAGLDHGVAF